MLGSCHSSMVIVCDDFTRYTWVLFVRHKKLDAASEFEDFISSVRDHRQLRKVYTDEGGEFISQASKGVCWHLKIKHELTTADSQ